MKLSIIIPCYNEKDTILKVVENIHAIYKNEKEIIIIDDFSSDGSRDLLIKNADKLKYHLKLNDKNYGKGFCIKEGIKKVTGDFTIIQDADLEYDIRDYNNLLKPIIDNQADVVFGSRFQTTHEKRILYFWHYVGNYILTLFSNMMSNLNFSDVEVGLKVFRSTILKNIKLNENRFGFEPEITAKISKLNLRIYEVGISYNGRTYEEGKKITWKDGLSAIRCIVYYNLFIK